jgi:hypothetical protein
MSTKINVRSPFYIKYTEPTLPAVALTSALINLQGFEVDQFGNVVLPVTDYGTILSYTSTAGDFTDGRFATVGSATSRTVTFTISIPPNFSNAGDSTIDVNATATQPQFVCSGGVTLNGSVPNQSIDTDGDTATVNLASYFTQGTDPISSYSITNNNLDYFTHTLTGASLTIIGTTRAGTKKLYVEASDGDAATCNATQPIQITTTAQVTYACTDAYFLGGSISQAGVIVNPTVNGTITAIKDSSGGSTITSYPANTTGSDRNVTLFFDITVPTGYSNTSATVECSKTFSQPTAALPLFTCSIASLTNQAITSFGSISKGIADVGTIADFSPIGFDSVTVDTSRTVTYSITPPASGYSNSGGSNISCDITMTQPAIQPTAGTHIWYTGGAGYAFMTIAQAASAQPSFSTLLQKQISIEGQLGIQGIADPKQKIIQKANIPLKMESATPENLVSTYSFLDNGALPPRLFQTQSSQASPYNPTGGYYWRIDRVKESGGYISPAFQLTSYYMKLETTGLITEVWFVDWYAKTFTKIA